MAAITLRLVKGSDLEWNEVDDNFTNINNDLIQAISDISDLDGYLDVSFVSSDTVLTRSKRQIVGIDVSVQSVLVDLPPNPVAGDKVSFFCSGGDYAVNAMIVGRNTKTIMGLSENMTVSNTNQSFDMYYSGSTWRLA